MASKNKNDERIISIDIRRDSIRVVHRHSIEDVAFMVHALARYFEKDDDLAVILGCAIKLYQKNLRTKMT
jgi:hypothetical protein